MSALDSVAAADTDEGAQLLELNALLQRGRDESVYGSGTATSLTGTGYAPAYITIGDGEDATKVPLNVSPQSIDIEKGQNTFDSKTDRRPGKNAGGAQFKGAQAMTLTITGAILSYPDASTDISPLITDLQSGLYPPDGSSQTALPPTCTFTWGSWQPIGPAYLKSLKISVTDNLSDGTPVSATVTSLVLSEVPGSDPGPNPTSRGAFGSRSTHTVIAGDSLASISNSAYGRPDLWRAIADINGIDDPLRLHAGTELLIPPRELAKGYK